MSEIEKSGEFEGVPEQDATDLMLSNEYDELADKVAVIEGLKPEMIPVLIAHHHADAVAKHWNRFGVDRDEALRQLIEAYDGRAVVENIDSFEGADREKLADRLIESGQVRALVEGIDAFPIDRAKVAERLMVLEEGPRVAADHIEKFPGIDQTALADRLLQTPLVPGINDPSAHGDALAFAYNFDKFTDLDASEYADRLIEGRRGEQLAAQVKKFSGVDHDDVARRIAVSGDAWAVLDHVDEFTFSDPNGVLPEVLSRATDADIKHDIGKILKVKGLSETLRDEVVMRAERK